VICFWRNEGLLQKGCYSRAQERRAVALFFFLVLNQRAGGLDSHAELLAYQVMKRAVLLLLSTLVIVVVPVEAATIKFSGYEWAVRSGRGGPGPNLWDESNVALDDSGALRLKISHHGDQWSCAEVTLQKRLGFGQYEFQIKGAIDRLDDNVVLGLFNYPTRDVGPDATHEIDIEFARWGAAKNPMGNYTVWPVEKGLKQQSKSFPFTLEIGESTHRFTWNKSQILFQSLRGLRTDDGEEFSRWVFSPPEAARSISQRPMPIHINFWLFKGVPPKNGQEIEVVVRKFAFAP
jgi:hypothetical protein